MIKKNFIFFGIGLGVLFGILLIFVFNSPISNDDSTLQITINKEIYSKKDLIEIKVKNISKKTATLQNTGGSISIKNISTGQYICEILVTQNIVQFFEGEEFTKKCNLINERTLDIGTYQISVVYLIENDKFTSIHFFEII